MNSNDIRYWAKKLQIKDFLGTYAVDQLKCIKKSQLGSLIFNTDIASKIGKHWVAIHIDKNVLTVFDPLGYKNLDLTCPFLKSFLSNKGKIFVLITYKYRLKHHLIVGSIAYCFVTQFPKKLLIQPFNCF